METETYRRFIPIGTEKQMDKFKTLVEEKNLSREDLAVILRAIKLNPDIDYLRKSISESVTAAFDTAMDSWAADFASRLDLAVHDTP